MTLVLMLVGLVFLVGGAELLVRGASRLAATFGLSPLVVGLTVVAVGTSAPEVTVSVASVWQGHPELALTSVVGSNIFNTLCILGMAATVAPLLVTGDLIRRDVPIVLGSSVLVLVLALDQRLGRAEGVLLLTALLAYTFWRIRGGADEDRADTPPTSDGGATAVSVGFVLVGLFALVRGADWLVDGAIALASWLGIGEVIIGLTIVAAGTSLPELATSVLAAARGERDIAVGNVMGSNLFNLLGVLGISAAVAPSGLVVPDGLLGFDLPFMAVVALACVPLFATGRRLVRGEGVGLLACYVLYVTYLILRATEHRALDDLHFFLTTIAFPVAILAIGGMAWSARAERLRGDV